MARQQVNLQAQLVKAHMEEGNKNSSQSFPAQAFL